MVQLVEPNRSVPHSLEHGLMKVVKVMKDYFTRANHIYYMKPDDDNVYKTRYLD